MKRFLPLFMLVMLAGEAAHPQGFPPLPLPPLPAPVAPIQSTTEIGSPRPPDEIHEIVRGNRRMTTKIAFVIDTSSSMQTEGRVQMSLTFARDLLGRPGDELLVQMFSFKSSHVRWPGFRPDPNELRFGPPPPEGWTEFPSVPALESAQRWLNAQGANGCTNPVGAMAAALQLRQRGLTVVLITDGEFYGVRIAQFLATVEASQRDRVKKGLGRAVIFVIGTGPESIKQPHLLAVGGANGGGMHVIRPASRGKAKWAK